MSKWLSEILEEGHLFDNQVYDVKNKVWNNFRRHSSFNLLERGYRQKNTVQNCNEDVWSFLKTSHRKLKSNSGSIINAVQTFNSREYEHNSSDPLINISGFHWPNFQLTTSNVIGEIKEGNYSLRVSSRFGDDFLKYIIADADGFLEIENFGGFKENGQNNWLLIYLWKTKLKKAFRLGIPKIYETNTEESNKVRGNIDPIHYHIHRDRGKYRNTFREHSYLTPASLLISEVFRLENVQSFTYDIHNISKAFLNASKGIRIKRSELGNVKKFSNPFYSDYNEVIDLSLFLLRNQNLEMGKVNEFSAFLFDVSMLFEYFIKKSLMRSGLNIQSKFSEALKVTTGTRKRELQPDLIIETDSGTHIYDVKYKAFLESEGVSRNDIFQIHTYIGQYGNQNKIKSCGFVYPKRGAKNRFIEKEIYSMGVKIKFIIGFLAVPDSEKDPEKFAKKFRFNCSSFNENFIQLIDSN